MLTVIDKTIAALLPGVFLWLNQKYGFKFDVSPENMAALASLLGSVLVYMVPNKAPATPTGGPSSMNAGAKGAIILAVLAGGLGLAQPSRAADVAKPKAIAFVPCTPIACTGWYAGFNLAGVATNVNVLGNGINGSLNAGGQNIGIQGGYQFWNGTFFFGPEVGIDYTYGGTVGATGGQSSPKYLASEVIKLGTPFSTFFGSAPTPASTTGLSSILTANTIAP
jgi:hypothetical protein